MRVVALCAAFAPLALAAIPRAELLPDKCDALRWRVKVRLVNDGAGPILFNVKVTGRPEHSQPSGVEKLDSAAAGAVHVVAVSGPIIGDERVDLDIDVRDALSGQEYLVKRIAGWRPNGKGGDADLERGVKFRFAYYPSWSKVRIAADASRISPRPKGFDAALMDAAGAVLATTKLVVGTNHVADTVWSVPDLGEATRRSGKTEYAIRLSDVSTGYSETRKFERCVLPWEGYRGGQSDAVPPPFEPVKSRPRRNSSKEEIVSVLLRHHLVDRKTGLWKQVVAAGRPVLARPMRLVASSASELAALSGRCEWDVDGCCVWRLALPAGRHGPLSLEIPLRAERAKLMHVCTDGMRRNYAGAIPSGAGVVWESSKAWRSRIRGRYVPYVWIGGPLRGIAAFCDNDRGWEGGCQDIVREKDGTVVLRFTFFERPTRLKEPTTIRLGFQATPVKPMEDGWRGRSPGILLGTCKCWGAFTGCADMHPYDGTDEFFRKMGEAKATGKYDDAYAVRCAAERASFVPEELAQERQKVYSSHLVNMRCGLRESSLRRKDAARRLAFYTNARGVRLGTPDGRTFCDEWTGGEFASRPYAWGANVAYAGEPTASYRDFAAYWMERMLRTGACDYLYWDCVFLRSSFDLVGSDAYVRRDGRIEPSTGLFNMRALVRRAAVLQTELGLESRRNWVHMTNTAIAPVVSFAGLNYEWEDMPSNRPLHERYSRELIQAEATGRQFGNKTAVMAYFAANDPQSDALKTLERQGTGLCLTHEIWWGRVSAWGRAHRLLKSLGYADASAKVWNYWDEDVQFPAAIAGGETSALAFAHGGRAVVVVSDWSGGAEYSIAPDAKALGIKSGFRARNAETGEEIAVSDGRVKVTLGKYDYAVVVFE